MQARRVFFCKQKQDCQVNCRMQARWVAVVVFMRVETKNCKAGNYFLNFLDTNSLLTAPGYLRTNEHCHKSINILNFF